jgi:hypothetical protein
VAIRSFDEAALDVVKRSIRKRHENPYLFRGEHFALLTRKEHTTQA